MRVRALAAVVSIFSVVAAADAVDLTKIDRRIRAEPKYETASPTYCLVVFGPQAKKRVWLVRDGNTIHLDRNSNGILGEPGEKVRSKYSSWFTIENILPPTKSGKPNKLRLYGYSSGYRMRFYGEQYQFVGFGREKKLQFSKKPATAPIVHFNGPVTMARYAEAVTLRPGSAKKSYRLTSLRLAVGTKGLGPGTFAALHCRCRRDKGDLMATFRFPSATSETKIVEERVKLKTYG